MPATKIVLTVDGGLTEQDVSDLRHLLADALSEFAATRANPAEYVRQRYPDNKEDFYAFDGKLAQVERRVDLARKLHDAALNVELIK